jgi:tRNA (cytidine56-2'-O)-methyltransferase
MIAVMRIGHRPDRDKRITTHVALVARAFGAEKMFVDTKDRKLEETIRSVCVRFGGDFTIETGVSIKTILSRWEGSIIHLTMYGEKLDKSIKKIKKKNDILVIVGAEKVPAFLYERAEVNISVGNQPHSEVAALAVFLDRLSEGKWQNKKFNGKLMIVPCANGKNVVSGERKKGE